MTIQLSKLDSIVENVFHAWLTWHSYDNKYLIFYSFWPCLSHSLVESHSNQMYFICFIIIFIMAGFGFDDDDFSLIGLTQEGHNFDVTVIDSSCDDENYGGLLECAQKLDGDISEKTSSLEGGMQPGVEPGVKTGVKPKESRFSISKTVNMLPITPNSMASSVSQLDKLIHVSFIHFNGL